ncbi:hypothetical protein CC2G_002174 [Coprinopsis cinerea AmutBmut pab1-1]|nr:hypothetical protein CC2G_002174 [Coprinopsis cinerea AmutBmut pab1-1]
MRHSSTANVNEDAPYTNTPLGSGPSDSRSQPITNPPSDSTALIDEESSALEATSPSKQAQAQQVDGEVDGAEASDDEAGDQEPEPDSTFLMSLDDDEPTLQRVGLEDVEFDMDTVDREEAEEQDEEDMDEFTLEDTSILA